MQRIHLQKTKNKIRKESSPQGRGRSIYRPHERMTTRFVSSSALQNVVKGLAAVIEETRDMTARVKDNSMHCPSNNTVGKCYSAVFNTAFDDSFFFCEHSEPLSHIPKKAHCFLAC